MCMKNAWHNYRSEIYRTVFPFNRDAENVPKYSVLRNYLRKYMRNGKNNAKLNKAPSKFSPSLVENDGKIFRRGISVIGVYSFVGFKSLQPAP